MNFPSQETVAAVQAQYPRGTRVELIQMDDPHTTLRPGDRGRVMFVDGIGTVHIAWNNGSRRGSLKNVCHAGCSTEKRAAAATSEWIIARATPGRRNSAQGENACA